MTFDSENIGDFSSDKRNGLAAGADSGIGTTYSFMAEKFIVIKKLFEKGKVEKR